MSKTVLTTPVISLVFHWIALFFAKVLHWKLATDAPDIKKAVLIGAPHTSNWDFLAMLMGILIWRLDVRWIGKHTLFIGPMGPVMRWLGGIPINRRQSRDTVEQLVDYFNQQEQLLIVIAPEGTRKAVEQWHTGFYHIACNANVPIVMTYIDYKEKVIGVEAVEMPSGDVEKDIARYQAFYKTKAAYKPENYFGG